MSTARARARWLRGALVGGSSALITIGAHTAADGALPHGSALMVALLFCATAGALVGTVSLDSGRARILALVGALSATQLVGHLALALFAGHHHVSGALAMTPSMATAHAAAAVVLGVAIAAVEYLYVVCESVLCWLRLFTLSAVRVTSPAPLWATNNVVVQPVLLRSGLGMRAPPAPAF